MVYSLASYYINIKILANSLASNFNAYAAKILQYNNATCWLVAAANDMLRMLAADVWRSLSCWQLGLLACSG